MLAVELEPAARMQRGQTSVSKPEVLFVADDFPSRHTLADRLLLNRSTAALSVYKTLLRRALRIPGNFVSVVLVFLVSR